MGGGSVLGGGRRAGVAGRGAGRGEGRRVWGAGKRTAGTMQCKRIAKRIAVMAGPKEVGKLWVRVAGWLDDAMTWPNSDLMRIELEFGLAGFCAFVPFRKTFKNEFAGHSYRKHKVVFLGGFF